MEGANGKRSMAEGNGTSPTALPPQVAAERLVANASALLDRLSYARRHGLMFDGERDVYSALGWKRSLTFDDFKAKYDRQDIAGRIVDLPPAATWREGFTLTDDEENPDRDTPFEKAWKGLDKRLRLTSWLGRVDRLACLGKFSLLYLGLRGQEAAQPLRKANPQDLIYVSAFSEATAEIDLLDLDPSSERFGLPERYGLRVLDRLPGGRALQPARDPALVHWSRAIHVTAEGVEDNPLYGRPRLERVFNLLEALQLVVGATGEGFWRSARPRYHANISADAAGMATPADLEKMGDEIAEMLHGLKDWVRTSYTDINQLSASVSDPRGAVEVIVDMLAAASEIPKRILLGSERGELASSQDAQEWAHRVAERQNNHAEPVLVRQLVDRFISAGLLPEPKNDYVVEWPDLTGPNQSQRDEHVERMTKAEAAHAQAELLGVALVTRNELRESWGLVPLDELDEDYPGQLREIAAEEEREQALEEQKLLPPPQAQPEADESAEDEDGEEGVAAARRHPFAVSSLDDLRANALPMITRAVGAISARALAAELRDPVLATIADTAGVAARAFGLDGADVNTAAVREFMADLTRERSEMITNTTQQRVIEALLEGQLEGDGVKQLKTRVRRLFSRMGRTRAPGIATSESVRAAAAGTLTGFMNAGVATKSWRTQHDNDVRPAHVEMDGQTVPMSAMFTAPNGEQAPGPGLFPSPELSINCRCYVTTFEQPTDPAVLATLPRRRDVHRRRVLAAVRRALRQQRDAVLRELDEPGSPRALGIVKRDVSTQPREPKGTPTGGRWTKGGTGTTNWGDLSTTEARIPGPALLDHAVPASLRGLRLRIGDPEVHDEPGPDHGGPYFDARTGQVHGLGAIGGKRPDLNRAHILRHEWGHYLDWQLGGGPGKPWSATIEYLVPRDGRLLEAAAGTGEENDPVLILFAAARALPEREFNAVADFALAVTMGKYGHGHPTAYFLVPGKRSSEMFAQLVTVYESEAARGFLERLAPSWTAAAEGMIEGAQAEGAAAGS